MPPLPRPLRRRHARRLGAMRRAIVVAILFAYVSTAIGVPLPAVSGSRSNSSEPFPCAGSLCGCGSAARCWNDCCCHSLAERLAWAKKRGVRPPQSTIAQARSTGVDVAWLDASLPRASACASDTSCTIESTKTCCATTPGATDEAGTPSQPCHDDTPSHVILLKALACQGQSPNWLAAVPTMVHVTLEVSGDIPPPAWIHPPRSEAATSNPAEPAVPPPEAA